MYAYVLVVCEVYFQWKNQQWEKKKYSIENLIFLFGNTTVVPDVSCSLIVYSPNFGWGLAILYLLLYNII